MSVQNDNNIEDLLNDFDFNENDNPKEYIAGINTLSVYAKRSKFIEEQTIQEFYDTHNFKGKKFKTKNNKKIAFTFYPVGYNNKESDAY